MNPIKCINPHCDNRQYARGLCPRCYHSARNLVIKGKTTWQDLEAKGLVVKLVRPSKNLFVKWLEEQP